MNSFFSVKFSILPLFLIRYFLHKKASILIAPRGEFSPGALKIKSLKKFFYILLSKLSRINQRVIWHATSQDEANDIRRVMGPKANIFYAPNIVSRTLLPNLSTKEIGSLKIVYLSRITEKKNLLFALKTLSAVKANIVLDIYGVKEDLNYWKKCEFVISKLPNNIEVNYKGTVIPDEVPKIFQKYDLFFFPTKGENFGHAIVESLCSGCPILISNLTPWHDLEEKEAGWICDLTQENNFVQHIEELAQLNAKEYQHFHECAHQYIKSYLDQCDDQALTLKMFNSIIKTKD